MIGMAGCVDSSRNSVSVRSTSYGPHPSQKADVYELQGQPPAKASRPAVLLIHGGGWVAGGREDFADMARWFAHQGVVAVSIGYRLTPKAQWPAQAEDVEHAAWWLRENAPAMNIDTERIIAIGGSAGGHLAAWLGTTNKVNAKGTPSRVNLVISLWGPWDLTTANIREDARNMIAALMGPLPARSASPIFHIDSRSAPALLIHGTADELVPPDQSIRACEALKAARVECDLMLLEGEGHELTGNNPAAVLGRVKRFVTRHMQTRAESGAVR